MRDRLVWKIVIGLIVLTILYFLFVEFVGRGLFY